MTKRWLVLTTSVILGCQPGSVDVENTETAAYSGSPASECNSADTFTPPAFSLLDLAAILGKVTYYSIGPATFQELFTGSWTNWSSSDMNTALAKLATMRSVLDKYNLHDTYLPGSRPQVDCSRVDTSVRQADGTCNDLTNTTAGAVGARIGRNIPVFVPNSASPTGYAPNPFAYPPATEAALLSPSPREVSRNLFTRGASGTKTVPFLNMLAAAWIQFQVHDWFDHDNTSSPELFHIPLATDDPLRSLNISELLVPKTMRDTSAAGQPLPPVYHNLTTHWWDGSQMYGTTKAQSDSLRANVGGKVMAELAMVANGLLPKAADGFEQTGMRKNWWIGLGVMHTLFAREHNAIVAMLKKSHREHAGDEDWYFSHARMINSAVIAKIHTVEWTPAILPNRTATIGLHANWFGLKKYLGPVSQAGLPVFMATAGATIMADPTLTAAEKQERIGAAKAAINGVLGGDTNNHGVPYSLTEEFVSVYRMHPLLPDNISIYNVGENKPQAVIPTDQTRTAAARAIEEKYGMGNVVYSFGVQHPGALVLANYPAFLQKLQVPMMPVMDMGAIDVLRDRERGLPRYNDFREQLRLKRVASIEALTDDPTLRAALHKVYGSDAGAIDRVDALVGTFGESTRPSCYGFGETLFQVFTEMATRRLQADRFYTTDYNAATYTAEGIQWVADASMKSVLLRHYGNELQNTGLIAVQNAFYPWK